MKNVSIIVEARMGSSRLTGKVMKKILNKPVLELLIDRLKQVKLVNKIIIATTKNQNDRKIVNLAKKKKVKFFCGSEDNVMQRVKNAAIKHKSKIIISITGDCPLIDPRIIDQAINLYKFNNVDYVSNCHVRSYPDGMDVQVYSLKTLKKSYKLTKSKLDREHVTLHIRKNPKLFKTIHFLSSNEEYWPDLGLTIDEEKDFVLIKKIYSRLKKRKKTFSLIEILKLLRANPKLLKINKNVKRKIV